MYSKNTSFYSSVSQSSITFVIFYLLINCVVNAQRGFYAGSRNQNGYKDRFRPATPQQDIVSRFGDDPNRVQRPPISVSNVVQPAQGFIPINQQTDLSNRNTIETASSRLPYDALGDRELVERLNRLPLDQRPFWLVNAQAIEASRNRSTPQSGNFNPVAERGSFAGSGEFSVQPEQRPQEAVPLNRVSVGNTQQRQPQRQPQRPSQRQPPSVILSRGDFSSVSGNNLIDLNRNTQRPINSINSIANEVDSQGGRFVYVGPQLYNELKKANLIV